MAHTARTNDVFATKIGISSPDSNMVASAMRWFALLGLALWALPAMAHPLPDVPVRARFSDDGAAVIQVEVDPRCLEEDPLNTPYLLKRELDEMSVARQKELQERTAALIAKTVRFVFDSTALTPEFDYS